jgi:hypothetical protein
LAQVSSFSEWRVSPAGGPEKLTGVGRNMGGKQAGLVSCETGLVGRRFYIKSSYISALDMATKSVYSS